ncbi:glutathione peroxidase [Flavobacterium oreochromis]|uniref:Glutathione peroxidase n=2 Tax=Flavobacterium TaxID=237 RepID=A0A2D0AHJ2_9FLAO|nr:glutathione peroxidase [Flavobacterium oreochromis]OWP75442.1 glutathione peroxidase [Flavobacterium oreochromis]OWP75601.1 glutathione peroxidase [Flavobacterium oreochromis]POR23900.1 glutathione peroxidase [Flavobacterium columnare]QYS85831.1 glutathione peroxidase [Flavobacterium oreochromis]
MSRVIAILCMFFCAMTWAQKSKLNDEYMNTIYQFKVKDISGNEFDLAKLKGKKVMIVNTASECGLTPQYVQLEELYKKYKDNNFVIIGFPANNFGSQEPGSNEQIATFCKKNYGVSFPMMEKISVKGADIHPLYSFLTQKKQNGTLDNDVKWNFQKYLIDENGKLVKMIAPQTLPNTDEILNWIKS